MGIFLDYFPHTGTLCYQASGKDMTTGPLSTTSCLQCEYQHKRRTPSEFCRISINLVETCLLSCSASGWYIIQILYWGFLITIICLQGGWLRRKRRCCFDEVIETCQVSHSWVQRAAPSCQDSIEERKEDMGLDGRVVKGSWSYISSAWG